MRTLLAIGLILFALPSLGQPNPGCAVLAKDFRVYGPELNLAQTESIGKTLAAKNPAVPQVPFAYGYKHWVQLKTLYQAGDVFRQYDGPRRSDGSPIAGGYVLMRGSCVKGLLGTWRT